MVKHSMRYDNLMKYSKRHLVYLEYRCRLVIMINHVMIMITTTVCS